MTRKGHKWRAWRWLLRCLKAPAFDENAGIDELNPVSNVKVIRRIERPDGHGAVELLLASNGFYTFVEWAMVAGDEFTGRYQSPIFQSGLYASLAEAERDARLTLPWLRDTAATLHALTQAAARPNRRAW